MTKFTCFKCGGAGKISAFSHIENGDCFTCGGSGHVAYQPKQKTVSDPHLDWLIPADLRSTTKQWEYFEKLCPNDRQACEIIENQAGAPCASQRYVSKAVMSKAIDIAKKIKAA